MSANRGWIAQSGLVASVSRRLFRMTRACQLARRAASACRDPGTESASDASDARAATPTSCKPSSQRRRLNSGEVSVLSSRLSCAA